MTVPARSARISFLGTTAELRDEHATIVVLSSSSLGNWAQYVAVRGASDKEGVDAWESLSVGRASTLVLNEHVAGNVILGKALPWQGGGWGEDQALACCLSACFEKALQADCKRVAIAIDGISTAEFPNSRDARITIRQVFIFLEAHFDFSVILIGEDVVTQAYTQELSRQEQLLGDDGALERLQLGSGGVVVFQGNIVNLTTDAIVNAANAALVVGRGVDGAIHRAAGPRLARACAEIGGCPTGQAVVTPAYGIPVDYIIHTVGPIWRGGADCEDELLACCYMSSLERAFERGCRSVAFPAISCGVYGFPAQRAVEIAVESVLAFKRLTMSDMQVTFCCFDEVMAALYRNEIERIVESESA